MKATRHYYVNVGQVAGIVVIGIITWKYLDIAAESLGVKRKSLKERIRDTFWG